MPEELIVPLLVLMVVGVLVFIAALFARNYIKVAPNQVLVLYGRKYADGKGFKLVTGGAAFCYPIIERHRLMPLDAFQVKFAVENVPSEEGVRVTVNAVSSLKIGSEAAYLESAVRRFLSLDMSEIENFAREVLEGGLRGVVATMTVEELVKERTAFGARVQEQVSNDLEQLGLLLDNFLIQDISDEGGYIDALGVKRTAEVKRDASIAEADARRDEDIRVAEAQRAADEKASTARRIGETAKAEAETEISNAEKSRDTVKAQNEALVKAEQAKIEISAQIAAAEKDKQLRTARIAAEEAEALARTRLQAEEKKRHDAELEATVIVEAERNKEAKIIDADGAREAAIITAEGEKQATIVGAEAERERLAKEAAGAMEAAQHQAQGRKAQAAAELAEMEARAAGEKAQKLADAEGTKAQKLADAEGTKAQKLAEAEGIRASLLAEAEGVQKKAEAYQQLDATGKLLEVLEAAPEVVAALGQAFKEAGEGTMAPMAQAIGQGLSNVDEIRLIEVGGGGKGGDQTKGGVLSQLTDITPSTVFRIVEQVKALGLQDLAVQAGKRLGIDLTAVVSDRKTGPVSADEAPTAAEETAEAEVTPASEPDGSETAETSPS